ncbi:hypothetical protein BKA70DRAFT_1316894 [Coprinopsis sp. MPI-PUGE-AT-0042]|nr:hypothetical protein BKA70DRAFT_1316894 [Coprinopsis sp. MPI-PUGE-AT-0042]
MPVEVMIRVDLMAVQVATNLVMSPWPLPGFPRTHILGTSARIKRPLQRHRLQRHHQPTTFSLALANVPLWLNPSCSDSSPPGESYSNTENAEQTAPCHLRPSMYSFMTFTATRSNNEGAVGWNTGGILHDNEMGLVVSAELVEKADVKSQDHGRLAFQMQD